MTGDTGALAASYPDPAHDAGREFAWSELEFRVAIREATPRSWTRPAVVSSARTSRAAGGVSLNVTSGLQERFSAPSGFPDTPISELALAGARLRRHALADPPTWFQGAGLIAARRRPPRRRLLEGSHPRRQPGPLPRARCLYWQGGPGGRDDPAGHGERGARGSDVTIVALARACPTRWRRRMR
jgi:hypothetical protein